MSFHLFERKCDTCPAMVVGPRVGGKARGRWLGYDQCPECRRKAKVSA